MNQPVNKFAGDVVAALSETQKLDLLDLLLKTAPVGREIDLGKPVHVNYRHQEYPRMVYKEGHVLTVANEKQLKAAQKNGFELKPHPDYDYSKLNRANVAPIAETGPPREDALSAEDLAALDDEDKAS